MPNNRPFQFTIAVAAMVFACSVSAQGPVATQASRSKGATVHQDRVGADYRPLTDLKSKTVFTRTVKLGKHEHYDVVVTDPYGIVRMTGSYRDWSLEVPDGLFTYFFANGKPESKGNFSYGAKLGTWQCWESDGTHRLDRVYHGKDWEQIQISLGLSEKAPTVGRPNVAEVTPELTPEGVQQSFP